MSLIDLASLVLAPTATKEGKVYSAIPDTGDGDMTFTRGSAATRVNSAGLIEKERANLLLQSNTFDTTWSTASTSVGSGQPDKDGGSTAWKLTKNGNAGYIQQGVSTSGVITQSIYAKAGTLDWIRISNSGFANATTYYDLANGVLGTSLSDVIDASIEDLGNGWYRLTQVLNGSGSGIRIFPAIADNDVSGTGGYLYIQDAMLNEGLVAQPYIETTTSAVYEGITDDVPRVDYSGGGCPSLLLEGQRTNLVEFSEYFGASEWTKYLSTITANATTAPDGTESADLILDNATNDAHAVFRNFSVSAGIYTWSVFAKAQNLNFLIISAYTGSHNRTWFDLSNGTIGTNAVGNTATITNFGNGWYRCSVSRNYTSGTFVYEVSTAPSNGVSSYIGSGNGIYAWGAQLEEGSYVSSYIPTYSVSSTRVADSCSKTGISELIGQSEGTLFVDITTTDDITTPTPIGISDGTASNRVLLYVGSGVLNALVTVSGVAQATITSSSILANTRYKMAISYKANDFAFYVNGVQIGTDTSGSVPACSKFNFDNGSGSAPFYGLNKQAILFPTRLTNDQLEELTK